MCLTAVIARPLNLPEEFPCKQCTGESTASSKKNVHSTCLCFCLAVTEQGLNGTGIPCTVQGFIHVPCARLSAALRTIEDM